MMTPGDVVDGSLGEMAEKLSRAIDERGGDGLLTLNGMAGGVPILVVVAKGHPAVDADRVLRRHLASIQREGVLNAIPPPWQKGDDA